MKRLPTIFQPEEVFGYLTEGKPTVIKNYLNYDDKMLSVFGRINYDYKGKYLFSATLRADGSSRFARGNRWGYFPSAAIAWRISDEEFMSAVTSSWLSNLKVRYSYGTAGNNNIDAGQFLKTFGSNAVTYINWATSYWSAGTKRKQSRLALGNKLYQQYRFGFWVFQQQTKSAPSNSIPIRQKIY